MPLLKTIGDMAFCFTHLTQLGDMRSLTTIGNYAFGQAGLLTQLGDMPELKTIGEVAFVGTRLKKLGNMRSLTLIGEGAFYKTLITQLGNMDSLTTIGDSAFQGCERLNSVHLPNTLKNVGKDAFEGCPLGDLTVQSGANFECRCANLANRLRQLDGIRRIVVTGGVPLQHSDYISRCVLGARRSPADFSRPKP